ncbi:hypothetical protein, partial [Brevibacterium luteolum]|uniref:hypothetical protein n=1 Tax=Brevibacterium luteolum TaxID=199591 RepID=UPI00223C0721
MKSTASAGRRRRWRAGLAAGIAVAIGSAGVLSALPAQAAETEVKDAVFTWGVNKESGSGAYL